MSKLREQMIQDMTLRGLSPNTHRTYLQAVSQMAQHYGRSPDRISNRDVKAYLFHLHQNKKRSTSTCNVAAAALRFLYHQRLGRSHTDFDIPIARELRKLPHVLSRDEVARLLSRTHFLKHRVLFLVAYSTGLRVSEVVKLRPSDIDSDRRVIRVEQGKGARDRTTLLSPRLLEVLRHYRQHEQPGRWLFPSRNKRGHLCTGALGGHLEQCDRCGHRRPVYHSCRNRHCLKCQSLDQQDWLEARRADLLPIPYFHVVFTLPHALNRLARGRPRLIYDLLFHAASDTLQTLARDPSAATS